MYVGALSSGMGKGAARLSHADYSVIEDVVIAASATPARLTDVLQEKWPGRFSSPSAAKKALRRRLVVVDDDDCGTVADMVSSGQRLRLLARVAPGPAPGQGRRQKLASGSALQCVYEDDYLAVVNKPAGLSVQGEVRTRLALGLTPTSIRGDVGDDQPLWRPQHVHRLDTPTSGLLVCAKTGQALRELSASFAARRVHKRYRALLHGRLVEPDGTTTTPLSGQAARTEWRVVGRFSSLEASSSTTGGPGGAEVTLVDFFPETGRTHQLRRHAQLLGHPIVGDDKYGDDKYGDDRREATCADGNCADSGGGSRGEIRAAGPDGLMLAAVQIELPHPKHGTPLVVRTEMPERFEAYLADFRSVQ